LTTLITHYQLKTSTRSYSTSSFVRDYRNRLITRHFLLNFGTAKNLKKLCKILLRAGGTSLSSLKFSYNCSGGNSRPSRLSGVGGGNFLQTKVGLFLFALASIHALLHSPFDHN